MSSPAHARYRERLARLAGDDVLLPSLERADRALGGSSAGRDWRRTYARFTPDARPYAHLVFESGAGPQSLLNVAVFDQRPEADGAEADLDFEASIGWIRVTHFSSDAKLPSLPAVLRACPSATVLRYRPSKRCTIRCADGPDVRFAKVFANGDGEHIHADALALWQAADQGRLGFAVARPDRYDPLTHTVWQHQVPGSPLVDRLLGPDGPELAQRMGRAAASITRSGLQPGVVFGAEAQLERSHRAAADLGRRVPRLAPAAFLLLSRLAAAHAAPGTLPHRPIHGAPHPNQWLEDGPTLGLVDFDRLCAGDSELDVATFLGELDFEDGLQAPIEEVERAFLAGYEAVSGRLDRALLAAYRAHKRLAKALRSARALRPDGDDRAERHLERALECLP